MVRQQNPHTDWETEAGIRVTNAMTAKQKDLAGIAALTLVESLMIHLEEKGIVTAPERDQIFDTAIDAHREANKEDDATAHQAVVALLRTLRDRSDGVSVVGRLPAY